MPFRNVIIGLITWPALVALVACNMPISKGDMPVSQTEETAIDSKPLGPAPGPGGRAADPDLAVHREYEDARRSDRPEAALALFLRRHPDHALSGTARACLEHVRAGGDATQCESPRR